MFRGKSETPQSLVEQEVRLRSGESPLEQNSSFKSQQDTIRFFKKVKRDMTLPGRR
ncbi:Uncharacterized protein XB16_1737 [Leptospira santarosai]|uniref:Uncharacterized protein n=1 Tax=Leptospira santarosai TaxID=28183 RepID=A0A2P1QT30_9LEPT|nr:Uncharacterized protein XB16_1737 [Leptospira santarosai]